MNYAEFNLKCDAKGSFHQDVKHSFVLEKKLGISFYKYQHRCHFSSSSAAFFPVTIRKTSSILPFVIS